MKPGTACPSVINTTNMTQSQVVNKVLEVILFGKYEPISFHDICQAKARHRHEGLCCCTIFSPGEREIARCPRRSLERCICRTAMAPRENLLASGCRGARRSVRLTSDPRRSAGAISWSSPGLEGGLTKALHQMGYAKCWKADLGDQERRAWRSVGAECDVDGTYLVRSVDELKLALAVGSLRCSRSMRCSLDGYPDGVRRRPLSPSPKSINRVADCGQRTRGGILRNTVETLAWIWTVKSPSAIQPQHVGDGPADTGRRTRFMHGSRWRERAK
jgi:hypothetical protein